jgi:hypothetical protein
MRVYVTKYALTEGVRVVDAEITTTSATMICYRIGDNYDDYAHAGDWFTNAEEAAQQVQKLREKQVASLQKRLDKMKAKRLETAADLAAREIQR